MDALRRPFLRISPEFGTYAEENGVFDLFEVMLREVLIARPENPLDFLVKLLSKPIIDGMIMIPISCVGLCSNTCGERERKWGELSS